MIRSCFCSSALYSAFLAWWISTRFPSVSARRSLRTRSASSGFSSTFMTPSSRCEGFTDGDSVASAGRARKGAGRGGPTRRSVRGAWSRVRPEGPPGPSGAVHRPDPAVQPDRFDSRSTRCLTRRAPRRVGEPSTCGRGKSAPALTRESSMADSETFGVDPRRLHPCDQYDHICFIKNAVDHPDVIIGDYTYYSDLVNRPEDFQKNNVLYLDQFHDKL